MRQQLFASERLPFQTGLADTSRDLWRATGCRATMMAPSFVFAVVAAALSGPVDPAVGRAQALLAHMTLDEKIALTHGTGWGQNTTVSIALLCSLSLFCLVLLFLSLDNEGRESAPFDPRIHT